MLERAAQGLEYLSSGQSAQERPFGIEPGSFGRE